MPTTDWLWTVAKAAAAIGGFVAGYHLTPGWIIGIPFVQVVPAVFLAGWLIFLVELLRTLVDPRGRDRQFLRAAGAIVGAIAMILVHRALYRLDIVETPADEHYSKLSEDTET